MDATIIAGSLDDKELRKSIDDLVKYVDNQTHNMASNFVVAMNTMKGAMKDFAITQKVSVATMQEAWRKMSTSFDAMVAAQTNATGSGNNSGAGGKPSGTSVTELRNNISVVEQEIQAVEKKTAAWRASRDEIILMKNAIRAYRADVKNYEYRQNKGEVLSKTDLILYEDAKKKVERLTSELKELWAKRGNIPAPSKEDLQKYDELQRKLAELKKALDNAMAPGTVGDLEKQISTEERYRKKMELGTQELRDQNQLIAEQKKQLKEELMTEEERRKAIEKQNEALERQKAKQLKNAQSPYLYNFNKANTESSKDIASAEQKLRNLKKAVDDMRKSGLFDEVKLNKAQKAIDSLEQKIERMRSRKPMTLNEVIGMDESSVDAIAKKMAALKKATVDPQNSAQVKQLGNEYQRLKRLQAELMGQNIQMTHSNNYLAQSFGYIRNRLVYAMTLGAATNFVKQIYEIRSQYELLERSLGVLVNSFQRGSQIFQELNDMALKSPFTLIELATAAKQLTAYNFTANEVVNTTRRLADISAALGVPMERLTYNLGQIRAQTVLTARDARDFANAGLPIVKSLADYYSVLEKRVVSTGDVYDRMSKKMVSYNDVVAVLNKMTDEGGKFFDFQAKQAETLRVQLNNLTLAWNNMLNEMGEENQGILNLPVKGLKVLLQNWKSLDNLIWDVISLLGTFKGLQVIYAMHANKMGVVNMQMKSMYLGGQKIIDVFKNIGTAFANAFKNKYNWITLAAVALMDLAWSAWEAHKAIKAFHEAMRENATESIDSIDKFSETYKELRNTLNTASKSDIAKKISAEDSQKAWEAMKEEINTSVSSSTSLIAKLENINDINNRLKTGFDYLDKVKAVDASIQSMKDGVISISKDWAKWWNAWLAPEGLTQNVRDYVNAVKEGATSTYAAWEQMVRDLKPTIEDIFTYAQTEGFDATQQREFFERVLKNIAHQEKMSVDEYRTMRMQAEQEYANFAVGSAKSEFEQRRALQETFFTWMNERHSSELSSERIKELQQGTFLTGENAKWAKQRAQEFSKQYGTSFNDLWWFVQKANTWSIYIPVVFGNKQEQQKSFYDQLSEADKNANAAYSKIQRLQQRINELRAQGGDVSEISKELTRAQQDLKDAESAGGHASKQTKANASAQKTAVQEVSEALKDEIRLINEMRSNYDKLRKSGVSNMDAIDLASKGYEATIIRINQVLSKFGIDKFNAANFAGKDVRSLLQSLEEQRQALLASGKVKTSSLQALDVEIQKLTVDAKTYDMKKVTDGLNSELGKLKDEYELAIELDANPELGSMFADMFDINTDTLPKTIKEYADKYTQYLNKYLESNHSDLRFGAGELFNLTQDDINAFQSQVSSGAFNQAWFDEIKKAYDDINGKRRKELKDIFNNTKKLEYELAELNDKIAIKEKEQSLLHEKIEKEKNETTKHYLELTYQSNEKAIDDLRSQALSLMPEYARVFNSIAEYSSGVSRRLQRDLMRVFDEAKYDSANKKWTLTGSDGKQTILNDTQYRKEREKLTREMRKSQEPFKKIKEAFKPSDKNGVVDYAKGIELVSAEIQKLGSVASEVGNLAQIFGADEQTVEIINDVATSLNGVATAGQGISQIASGDYIGGAASVLSGITSIIGAWADNNNKRIDAEIKDSERAVKRLELAYIDLEQAVNKAMGTAVIGAKQAAIANKELQLTELQRQIQLEKSRDSKDRDEDKIIDLQKQYKELFYEIQNGYTELVDDLMGTDASGFAENLVSSMIDAFKQGEDYMEVFNEKFDEMIDNMIMKSIVSRVVSQHLDKIWKSVDEHINDRSKAESDEYAKAQNNLSRISQMTDEEIKNAIADSKASADGIINPLEWAVIRKRVTQKDIDEYRKAAKEEEKAAKMRLDAATEFNDSDVDYVMSEITKVMPELGEKLKEILGQYYKFGESSDKNLSALQQGIQGVTEDTAGAIEAYMNGVSQQVYLQSEYLRQIVDFINIDADPMDDVKVASLSQILLQLRDSYQVQQAIQARLDGWSNSNGMAVRVEMV